MAENTKTIQLRMDTVNTVSKITNAMKLVSMSKLQGYQKKLEELEALVREFEEIQTESFAQTEELPVLAVCVASDLGLASLYNQTVRRAMAKKDPDAVLWTGYQGYDRIERDQEFHLVNEKTSSDNLDLEKLYNQLLDYMEDYDLQLAVPMMKGDSLEVEWRELNRQLLHSDFVIYEPDYETANQRYQEFYIYLTLYETYYQAKYSENMTRRIAMDQATENANEMREELRNLYNQIRQEQITQEILELAAGVE